MMSDIDILPADLDILARTVWGEARGEPYDGQIAVAQVVLHRVASQHRRETTIAGAATEPYQFSCWLPSDPNRVQLMTITLGDRTFRVAYRAAIEAVDAADLVEGATHYHTHEVLPAWARGREPVAIIGRHRFYAGID